MRLFRLFLISILCIGLADARPGPDSNYNVNVVAGGGGGATTLNPADQANITLSGGNLVAVVSGGSDGSVRSTTSHSTGKYYFCGTNATQAPSGDSAIGIANGSASLTGAPNSTLLIAVLYPGSGGIWINGALQNSLAGGALNDVDDVAVDIGGQLIWVRRNNGIWNNNGSANPATGVGGFSFSGITGPYFAYVAVAGGSTQQYTIVFNGTCVNSAPAGFGNF